MTSLLIAFIFISIEVNAQEQKPFVAHEVIEIGGGQKIEILRCRGEGPLEECDCIYYTDRRQNGKRLWQNANQIRQEQKAAQLEVAAAKELAKSEAQKLAEAKAKEAAEMKAAKEKERTVSAETNAVLETLKDQNNEIKTKGAVKANAYRGSEAVAKQKQKAEESRKTALSLKEIARQRDSINRSKTPKKEDVAETETENETVVPEKAETGKPVPPVVKEATTKTTETKVAATEEKVPATEGKAPATDTSDVVDFEILRKQEEASGNASYVPPVKSAEEKTTTKEAEQKEEKAEEKSESKTETPKPEEAPAPKPAKVEEPVADTTSQPLMVDSLPSGGNIEAPSSDTVVVSETDTTDSSVADTTVIKNDEEVKPEEITEKIQEENISETIKNEMKSSEEKSNADDESMKKKEKKKKEKKPKKEKKEKKQKEEEEGTELEPAAADSTQQEPLPLTPLQMAARRADSISKAKENTDTTSVPEPKENLNSDKNENLYINAASSGAIDLENKSFALFKSYAVVRREN